MLVRLKELESSVGKCPDWILHQLARRLPREGVTTALGMAHRNNIVWEDSFVVPTSRMLDYLIDYHKIMLDRRYFPVLLHPVELY